MYEVYGYGRHAIDRLGFLAHWVVFIVLRLVFSSNSIVRAETMAIEGGLDWRERTVYLLVSSYLHTVHSMMGMAKKERTARILMNGEIRLHRGGMKLQLTSFVWHVKRITEE